MLDYTIRSHQQAVDLFPMLFQRRTSMRGPETAQRPPPPLRPALSKANLFYPAAPSPWQNFAGSPTRYVAKWLYAHQPPASPPTSSPLVLPSIKVVCIADTHSQQPGLPHGDILIHAGDLTNNGTFEELQSQLMWLNTLPHTHKIVVAGNHDLLLDNACHDAHKISLVEAAEVSQLNWGSIRYLECTSTTVHVKGRSVRIYGAPHTPKYGNSAFQYLRSAEVDVWHENIPENTDVVVTHGPALGHVDGKRAGNLGCAHLLRELRRVKPRVHVCGHIHEARGSESVDWGFLQWGYDMICSGEGTWKCVRWWIASFMACAWLWAWIVYGLLGKKRDAKTTFVNAALMGRQRFVDGERAVVVEI